jgi:hypothetical protein
MQDEITSTVLDEVL